MNAPCPQPTRRTATAALHSSCLSATPLATNPLCRCAGPAIPANQPGWRAGRSRDPRPPPHLHRSDAGCAAWSGLSRLYVLAVHACCLCHAMARAGLLGLCAASWAMSASISLRHPDTFPALRWSSVPLLPAGRVIQAMRKAGVRDPLLLLDEVRLFVSNETVVCCTDHVSNHGLLAYLPPGLPPAVPVSIHIIAPNGTQAACMCDKRSQPPHVLPDPHRLIRWEGTRGATLPPPCWRYPGAWPALKGIGMGLSHVLVGAPGHCSQPALLLPLFLALPYPGAGSLRTNMWMPPSVLFHQPLLRLSPSPC